MCISVVPPTLKLERLLQQDDVDLSAISHSRTRHGRHSRPSGGRHHRRRSASSSSRSRSRNRSPSIRRRKGSPSHLDKRRITRQLTVCIQTLPVTQMCNCQSQDTTQEAGGVVSVFDGCHHFVSHVQQLFCPAEESATVAMSCVILTSFDLF